jgi:hypothetical protein
MSVEWERLVRRPEDACATCHVRFGPGAEVVTLLDLSPEGFRREDRCPACFGAAPGEPFSFWRHRVPKTVKPGPRRLDLGYLTEFFKRLAGRERTDANAQRVFYIVALLLLRRRILEEIRRSTESGAEVLHLRLKREEKDFAVTDPGLDEAAMASIEADLAKIFELDPGEEPA